jgi:hypothetical protein
MRSQQVISRSFCSRDHMEIMIGAMKETAAVPTVAHRQRTARENLKI